jgi:glucan phosphorylase
MAETPVSPSPNVLEVAMEISLPTPVLDAVAARFGPRAAQEAAMSTSVGGIGPLLRERIIAQARHGVRVIGVSLLYDTVWTQTWHSWNHMSLERRPASSPLRQTLMDTGIHFDISFYDGTTAPVKVWKTEVDGAAFYFLDNPTIGDVVYPCAEDAPPGVADPQAWAEDQRLRHSWLVGRGALHLVKRLGFKPDIIVLSETPTLFAHPHLYNDGFQKDPYFADARCVFNDHTPLEYAHPIWPRSVLDRVKMDPVLYKDYLRRRDGREEMDVTQFLVARADGVFGVARKHAEVMRAMPSLKPYAGKIRHITNGVAPDLWRHPDWGEAATLDDTTLLALKDRLKAGFLDWLWRRANLWPMWLRSIQGMPLALWTRRITGYKRLDILHRIFGNPSWRRAFIDTGVVLVVGGRIYQRDNQSEQMVYNLVESLNQDETLSERIVFLHNYNVWEAPRLFHGGDASIMLSDDGREASATGFMKAQLNGGAIIANPDGAVPESVVFYAPGEEGVNGFGVSYQNGEPDAQSFLAALADFKAVHQNPARRAALIRAALAAAGQVDVGRTVRETLPFYADVLAGRAT